MSNLERIQQWEKLFGEYSDKLARIEDLKKAGRYGYQLRMPRKAARVAREKLVAWCEANGEYIPSCLK